MTLKNNMAPLPSSINLCASFHHHIQTGVTVRKRLSWILTTMTLTFDLWPWPFAWTSLLSLVITSEKFMMIRWWQHIEKGVADGQTDGLNILINRYNALPHKYGNGKCINKSKFKPTKYTSYQALTGELWVSIVSFFLGKPTVLHCIYLMCTEKTGVKWSPL